MTITTTTIKNSYSGDGSQDTFAYSFKISADADMQVIIRASTGTETVKTLTTHYTVTGAGVVTGGNVVFTTGNIPTSTETVVLRRATTQTQTLDLVENDPFTADSVESAFDKNLAAIQELQEEVNRSFKVSRTNTISSSEFTDSATSRASKTLGFDSSGDLTTVADFLPAGGDSAMFQYSTTTTDSDPGDGFLRLNNGTIASATIAYIDDKEYNGTDVSAWVQSFDDVSGNDTNRGRIRISKANTLDTWMVFKVTGAVTDATGYTKISLVYIDSAGTFANNDKVFVSFVASGEDGTIPGYYYKFDTGTSDADPGAGEIAFNNGTYASVTEIYIDDADANGATTQTDTATWGSSTSTIKGFLHIVDINDSSTYARFKITAAVSDESGYNKITVVHLASNNTFSAADELSVHFTRTGLKGDTGSTGATGASGVAGLAMTWSSSTSDADPGAGKIAFNNGTVSSVSILYVDDADDASVDISGFVQSWDDVSNSTARGFVTVTKEGTPSTYATFKVSGAVTDASGYTKVPVTHVVSNGTFSNTDGVGVQFVYSGADGSDGDMTSFTLAGTSGSSQTITNGNTVTIAAGNGITTTGGSTDTVTVAIASTVVETDEQNTFTKAQLPSTYTAALSATSGVLDYDTYQNFIITLASGSNTLAAPTTEASQVGQTGVIIFIQPSSSSAGTVSLHGDYETPAAGGLTLSSTNNAYDVVPYMVKADNSVLLGTPQLAFG